MKGKPLPTEYEKVIEGLAKILQLTYIMSIGEVAHPTRNRMEPVPISSNNDLKVLFSKHWNEFKDKNPRADLQNFKASQRKRIQSILDEILEKIPSFEHQDSKGKLNELYLDVGKYINEYLSQEAENKREISKEPHAMVKAWVIHFQFKRLNKELKDIEAIDKCLHAFKWSGSKERLRQLLVEVRSISSNSDGIKRKPTDKQLKDLGSAIDFITNNEAIAEARKTYSRLLVLP